jgi:hypothetical protein
VKLSFENDVVSLAAETDEERTICELLMAADGHVFRLNAATHRGFSLTELGAEADACRAPLNITHAIDVRFQSISNLAHTPFDLDDVRYHSIEGFWQGLKFDDESDRRRIARLWGAEARDAGKPAGQPPVFRYGTERIAAGSPEHWHLMRRACTAKFDQHRDARVRRDSRTIPGAIMAQIWMDLRADIEHAAGV